MKTKPLTATMVACLDDAIAAGGELVRYQGGYWAAANADRSHNGIPRPNHGDRTATALVLREYATFTEWKKGRKCDFPIRLKLTAKAG